MLKNLLSISFLLFTAWDIKAQNNQITINSGASFRISDRAIFGYNTAEGRHSDLPSLTNGICYYRKIYGFENESSLSASIGYNSIGVLSKKLFFPEKPDPNWGGTVNDEYYRKYELRLQSLELGLVYILKHTTKLNIMTSISVNYLFRVKSKIITEYPNGDEFRTFSKFKVVESVVPNASYNRTNLLASIGSEYKIFNLSHYVFIEIGSYLTDLKNVKSNVHPIWLDLGYTYKF